MTGGRWRRIVLSDFLAEHVVQLEEVVRVSGRRDVAREFWQRPHRWGGRVVEDGQSRLSSESNSASKFCRLAFDLTTLVIIDEPGPGGVRDARRDSRRGL